MTGHPSARLVTLALVSVSLLSAGCSRPGASPAISDPTTTSAQAQPSPTVSLSMPPSIEAPPTEPLVSEPPMPEPPAASIAVEGGDPVVGQLGSFSWENSGSDGPWLPGSPIHVGPGERLALILADPVGVANWTVSRTPEAANGAGVIGMAQGSGEPVTFAAPPPGSWSVSVDVWFVDNLGSAAYYWLMEVD